MKAKITDAIRQATELNNMQHTHARSSRVISPSTFSDTVENLLADVDFDTPSPPEPCELCAR